MSRLNGRLRVLTLRCEEASALLSYELDDSLPRLDRVALLCHLLVCRSCRRFRGRSACFARHTAAAGSSSPKRTRPRIDSPPKCESASPGRADRLPATMPAPTPCSNNSDIGICRLQGQEPFPVRYF